jgi:cation diffusion facilitator family transporter
MIALLIGYESVSRIFAPVPIHFTEAIPIACLGLAVNIASAFLLGGGHHDGRSHGHGHEHGHDGHDHDEAHAITTGAGIVVLEVFEDGAPPRAQSSPALAAPDVSIETVRPDGTRQLFAVAERDGYLESAAEIPEPHAFTAHVRIGGEDHTAVFEEHDHARPIVLRDYNMQAAIVHVMADAAVSVLVITGLLLALMFGWLWMDPLAGIIGACVIAVGLVA